MNIETYDDLHDIFYQLVLPKYTSDQIPSEAVEGVFAQLENLFDEDDLCSAEDMFNSIDEMIRLGWTKSVFLTK